MNLARFGPNLGQMRLTTVCGGLLFEATEFKDEELLICISDKRRSNPRGA